MCRFWRLPGLFLSLRHHHVVEVRLNDDKGLRLMVVTTSGDALHLLRLILDTPWHEGDERG